MSDPARAGLCIYAKDQQHLASFYETILGMARIHTSVEITVLQSSDIQLVAHRIPLNSASDIVLQRNKG